VSTARAIFCKRTRTLAALHNFSGADMFAKIAEDFLNAGNVVIDALQQL